MSWANGAWGPVIALLAFFLVGFAIMGAAAYFLRASRRAVAGHTRVPGRVVRLVQGPGFDDGEFPVITFETPVGRVVEFESTVGGRIFGYAPGKSVDVLFDPADPSATSRRRGGVLSLGYGGVRGDLDGVCAGLRRLRGVRFPVIAGDLRTPGIAA